MADVNLTCYHNEDLDRDYVLRQKQAAYATVKKPTLEQTEPVDLTGCTFEAEAKFGATVVNFVITVVDAPTARIQLFIARTNLAQFKGKIGTYDLLMTKTGVTKRLWGGTLEVLTGTTVPG